MISYKWYIGGRDNQGKIIAIVGLLAELGWAEVCSQY
jgi:hypothetical protein